MIAMRLTATTRLMQADLQIPRYYFGKQSADMLEAINNIRGDLRSHSRRIG